MIYINKIKKRSTFKIKTTHYLELSTTETIKLLGSTKSKITTDKNGEKMPQLQIAEVVLINRNIINDDYQESCIHLFLINHLVNY